MNLCNVRRGGERAQWLSDMGLHCVRPVEVGDEIMHCLFHSPTWEIQSAHPAPVPKCHSSAEEPANSLQKLWQDFTASILQKRREIS